MDSLKLPGFPVSTCNLPNGDVLVGMNDGVLVVVRDNQIYTTNKIHKNCIRKIIAHGGIFATCSRDETVCIWHVENYTKPFAVFKHKELFYTNEVLSIAFSHDGKRIASVTMRALCVWDITTLQCVKHVDIPEQVEYVAYGKNHIAVSAGKAAFIYDDEVNLVHTLQHECKVNMVVFYEAELSTLICGCSDGSIHLWNYICDAYVIKCVYTHHKSLVSTAMVTQTGLLVTASWDKTVCIYDLKKEKLLKKIEYFFAVVSVCLSQNGLLSFVSYNDGKLHTYQFIKRNTVKTALLSLSRCGLYADLQHLVLTHTSWLCDDTFMLNDNVIIA